jgi:hypothetical protein
VVQALTVKPLIQFLEYFKVFHQEKRLKNQEFESLAKISNVPACKCQQNPRTAAQSFFQTRQYLHLIPPRNFSLPEHSTLLRSMGISKFWQQKSVKQGNTRISQQKRS